MGLDGVEIIMAVEDAFDIQIEDAAAAKMVTPRLLIDYVLGKITTTTATVCLTQRAFNLLRKSLVQKCGLKRAQITPDARLSQLIGKVHRREWLDKITAELAIKKPPALVRPKWLTIVLFVAAVLAGVWAVALALPSLTTLAFLIFAVVAIGIGVIGAKLTQSQCTEFPTELQTVGTLARWVMTHKPDLANTNIPKWTPDQVEARVREIIVEQLGCKPDFSLDASFVKDLGLS